ncbi:meprin A subunit beta-like [Megalops cyprinoides]|uniref:meprin A subunit beta-like n=1 Tax=Megalops cyprinoides TaxID=118141 RepID=UPI0018654831|nr:meprin A subunit beta-like [Megalops cyprinoides]XP_036393816.1 meprin A subunit beta-like [Megalops cyprinoides]XP_036393817.1 meprin A subunit beta-like [Megalops cyprinoides]
MSFGSFLIVGLILQETLSMPQPFFNVSVLEEIDNLDITKINKDLNLLEGDILQSPRRSAILGNEYRWTSPVPYVFESGLEMNAKGVILRAFEQFRLKTCMDFKPRDTELNYVSVKKDAGCFSYVGNARIGGQILSIGLGCDYLGIVEHEFLHALGFYHEQSRYDRDDYVTIVWENILTGREHNFLKYSKNETTTLDTQYDYTSVMHYGKNEFANRTGPTIITKLPEFQDVIGQRLEMSQTDVVRLNRLYNCTSSIAFLEQCSFENETLCKMARCSRSNATWESVTYSPGGPVSGHTSLGMSTVSTSSFGGTNETNTTSPQNGTDFFMHFSTATGEEGDRAKLESRRMTPRRACTVQCLQFYYYHTGNESDQLNVWIREFEDDRDPTGTRRLVGQITGAPADYWQLQHVPLNATKTFQVEFEGIKGAGNSTGGFSIDDINLSETECPDRILQIRNAEQLIADRMYRLINSPRYYSRDGYGFQVLAVVGLDVIAVYTRLVSGNNDDQLQWPCAWRQITVGVLDQDPHIQQRMSYQVSITTDPTQQTWDDPRKVGNLITDSSGATFYANQAFRLFVMGQQNLMRRAFIKGGDIFLLITIQDISGLLFNNSLECSTELPSQNFTLFSGDHKDDGPCVIPKIETTVPPTTTTTASFSPRMVSSPAIVLLTALALLWSH